MIIIIIIFNNYDYPKMDVYWVFVYFMLLLYIVSKIPFYIKKNCCICFEYKFKYNFYSQCYHPDIICKECYNKLPIINTYDKPIICRICPLCRNEIFDITYKINNKIGNMIFICYRLVTIYFINFEDIFIGILLILYFELLRYDEYKIIYNSRKLYTRIIYIITALIHIEILKHSPEIIVNIIIYILNIIQLLLIFFSIFYNHKYAKYIN